MLLKRTRLQSPSPFSLYPALWIAPSRTMKLSVSLLLLAPLLASSSSHVELERTIAQNSVPSYAAYIKAFGKTHKDEEEYQMRKAIFEENARAILQHNLHAKSSFQMGFNQFTDRLDSELPLGYDKSHHAAWSTQSATASQRLLKSKMVRSYQSFNCVSENGKRVRVSHQFHYLRTGT